MVRWARLMVVTGAAMLTVLGLFTGPRVRADDSAVAATPDEAVRQSIEAAGEHYAGLCEHTVSPRDLGKTCVRFVAEQDGVRAYLAGRTFSEFTHWVFVARAESGWQPAGTVVLDFFAQPDIPWPQTNRASHA